MLLIREMKPKTLDLFAFNKLVHLLKEFFSQVFMDNLAIFQKQNAIRITIQIGQNMGSNQDRFLFLPQPF